MDPSRIDRLRIKSDIQKAQTTAEHNAMADLLLWNPQQEEGSAVPHVWALFEDPHTHQDVTFPSDPAGCLLLI